MVTGPGEGGRGASASRQAVRTPGTLWVLALPTLALSKQLAIMILICQWEVSGEIASGVKCNDLLSSVPLDPLGRCHHKRSRSVIALTIFQIMIFQIVAWLRGPHSPHRFHWAGPGSGEWREW